MRHFVLVESGYCAVAAFAVAVLARPVTAFVLPRYLPDLHYIYLITPGLILFTLSGPFAMIFNVLLYFWAAGRLASDPRLTAIPGFDPKAAAWRFEGMPQDALGIWTSPSGSKVAWFKDPDGNNLSVTQFYSGDAYYRGVLDLG